MEIFNKNNYCVILAGGKGRRLWPYSRMEYPKQFIDFFGTGRTQLQSTFDRFARLLPLENILVCTNREYADMVREQLPDLPKNNLLAEPLGRNTAPSVAWAHSRVRRENTDANIIVVPSDQMVINEDAFAHYVLEAFEFVSHHDLVLSLGVKPTRCEPGYGYIQMGEESDTKGVYKVQSFTEKPDREFAQLFMDSGEFLWNSGISVSNFRHLNKRLDLVLPVVLRKLIQQKSNYTLEDELAFVNEHYAVYPNLSIDYALLEHNEEVHVMECEFGWADLGTWHSIYESSAKDEEGNVVVNSEVMMENCHDNVIKLPKDKLAVISGLDGYIVAERDNVLLICPKSDSSALVRKYANQVQIKFGEKFV